MAWRALVSRRVHELRFVFQPEASSSEAVKAFLNNNYEGLKTLNPSFPFLVRRGADEEDPYLLATRAHGARELFGGAAEGSVLSRDCDRVRRRNAAAATQVRLRALGEEIPRWAQRGRRVDDARVSRRARREAPAIVARGRGPPRDRDQGRLGGTLPFGRAPRGGGRPRRICARIPFLRVVLARVRRGGPGVGGLEEPLGEEALGDADAVAVASRVR